jgi:predicted nucleic acid-binding protein
MIVVADSGPLHYLILLEPVDLLRRFYGQVLVPEAVASELSAAGTPDLVRQWITKPPPADLLERLKTTSFYLDEALVNMVFEPWLRP